MTEERSPRLPLDGIRVVDFGQYIAAPSATMALRELGADVIKVEPPTGETSRHAGPYGAGMQLAYGRGKRSIAIDLKSAAGRDVQRRLIDTTDVVVHNFKRSTAQKLGLDAATVHAANPKVIHASVSGFNIADRAADRPGLDIVAQAESGLMSVTGEASGPPMRVGSPVVDAAAGDCLVQGILAALIARSRTGEPQVVEVSLIDAALRMQAASWGEFAVSGHMPHRCGSGQRSIAPAADLMATMDGWVIISAYQDRHWQALCTVTGRDDLLSHPDCATAALRAARRPTWRTAMDPYFAARSSAQCVAELTGVGVSAGIVRDYQSILDDEALRASATFVQVDGHRPVAASAAFTLVGGMHRTAEPPPAVGGDSVAVLTELGYDEQEITDLVAGWVVHGTPAH